MKIASWNVNSLRVRLAHVVDWLKRTNTDILALQEIKLSDAQFPVEDIEAAGYSAVFAGQKTYNGVAILAKQSLGNVLRDVPDLDDPQRRIIIADVGSLRVMNVYVPNGESIESDKYRYKLEWLEAVTAHVRDEIASHDRFVMLGDFNIAPADADVYKPERWQGKVLCSEPERAALQRLLDLGLVDTFRQFEQEPASYSWWDYRFNGFKRNAGLRIDLVLASEALARTCTSSLIDTQPRALERPSDHAPAVAVFD